MRETMTLTCQPGRLFVFAGLMILLLASADESLAQTSEIDESRSHRVLPPDAATLSRLQSQAALLYRLHQMVGQQEQLPGITDPERQQRLQQIMQQMALRLGQSELQLPGQDRRPRGGRSGRSGTGRSGRPGQGFQPGTSRPGQPGTDEPGFGTGANSTQSLRSFLEKISGGRLGSQGQPAGSSGQNTGRFPWSSPPDRGTGYTRPGIPPGQTPEWQQAPDTSWQSGDASASPFDDATDDSLSLTERFTRIADRARVDSLGRKSSDKESTGGGSSWLSNAGIQSALSRAIDGAARSVAERTADGSSTEPGRRQPRGPRPADGSGNGGLRRIGETAEWIGNLANRATEASESIHESMVDSETGAAGTSSFRIADLILPALLIAAAAGVLWWLQNRRPEFGEDSPGRPVAKMPATIRTRQDIVTAFHVITARAPAVSANWWTHRRAALALAQSNPKSGSDVETLTELYEQARYLPENESLTDEQLAQASAAVRRIGRS